MGNIDYTQIVCILLGIYCVYRGIMIFVSGKLGAKEEARIRGFSENGVRRYKLFSAVMNIIGGVFVLVVSVIRMLNLVETTAYRIVVLSIVAVILIVYFLIWNSCKNAK